MLTKRKECFLAFNLQVITTTIPIPIITYMSIIRIFETNYYILGSLHIGNYLGAIRQWVQIKNIISYYIILYTIHIHMLYIHILYIHILYITNIHRHENMIFNIYYIHMIK